MFEWYRKKQSLSSKLLAIFATGMGLGFGLCGLASITSRLGTVDVYLATAGIILFSACLAGGVITALVVITIKITE
jgi:hypothetical protein